MSRTTDYTIVVHQTTSPDPRYVYPHPEDGRMLLSPWEETIDSHEDALAVFYKAIQWWDEQEVYYTITITGPRGFYRSHSIAPRRPLSLDKPAHPQLLTNA